MIRLIDKGEDGRISADDYALICRFWKGRGTPPPRQILPTLGVVVGEIACGFLYLDATGSGVAAMGWQATDPAASAYRAGVAMMRVVDFLEREAAALDYHTVQVTNAHPSFIKFLKRRGYGQGDSDLVHMFKGV